MGLSLTSGSYECLSLSGWVGTRLVLTRPRRLKVLAGLLEACLSLKVLRVWVFMVRFSLLPDSRSFLSVYSVWMDHRLCASGWVGGVIIAHGVGWWV